MEEENINEQTKINNVDVVEESSEVVGSEKVEIVEIAIDEPLSIASQDAFPALGQDNAELNHALLYSRDNPNQHPITAITGLREELDNIEALKTVYSNKKQQANFYEWKDENPLQENRDGFFVCICPGTNKIQKCNGKTDVLGVTVADAAFVGGQEYIEASDGKKVGRDSTYGLVVTLGIVDVRCESNIVVGDYVTPNQDGIAEKSNGNYGYLVTSIKDDNSINWATILLAQSSILSKLTANNVQNIDERMYTAEHNIVSTTNIANAAYAMAKESKDNTEIDIGIIEDKINEALNKVNENTDIIDNLSNTMNNASKTATQAKAIAESAVNSAEIIRSEAVAKANEALTSVNDLIADVEPITSWTDPSSGNSGASYFVEHIQNDLATKTEVEVAETNTQNVMAVAQKNAANIQSLVSSINKYNVGEYSQAYGLTLDEAQSILKEGIIYIPTVDHNESVEIPINGNGIDDISTEKFLKGYAYEWDGTGWYVSAAQSVIFSGEYVAGNAECPYWLVLDKDVEYDSVIYDLGGLYKWEDGAWVKVSSVIDNSISRAVSSIRQTANEIAAEVTSMTGDIAALDIRIADNTSTVQTLASHMIGEYITVESWDANGKDTNRIYYAQDTKLYWYYKDGAWNSTEKSYEAGLTGTMATIEQKADEDGASIALVVTGTGEDKKVNAASIVTAINKQSGESIVNLEANKINFEGFTTFLRPSDVGEGGTTSIDGGRITTGQISADRIDADNLKVKAANITDTLTIGQLPSDVATTADIPTDTSDLTNGAGYQTASQVTTITNETISTTNVVAQNLKVKAANIEGTLTASYIEVKDTNNNTIFKADSENHEVYASNLSSISADLGEVTAGAIKSRNYTGSEIIIWDMPEVITPDTYSDRLNYTTYEDEGYAIVAGIGNCTDENIVIPPLYNGLPVTSIDENAFDGCSTITSVNIPNSVTSIGWYAFRNCTSLTSVTIGNGVTSIGDYAFDNCTSLKSVYITDIEAWCKISFEAHYSNPLYYANNLYLNNNLVTALTLPASITSIGNEAFSECTSLTNITIPDSVTSIGTRAFRGCTSLTSVTIGNGVTSIGNQAFLYCTSLTSVTIPDSVTSIGGSAFSSCPLKNITIGNGVTSIDSYAFYNCSKLTTVYYCGTESEWSAISIGSDNTSLTDATIYYYSETEPTETGNYWHYGSDGFKISCDDELMIDSKYFQVTQDGDVVANSGAIGGLVLEQRNAKLSKAIKHTMSTEKICTIPSGTSGMTTDDIWYLYSVLRGYTISDFISDAQDEFFGNVTVKPTSDDGYNTVVLSEIENKSFTIGVGRIIKNSSLTSNISVKVTFDIEYYSIETDDSVKCTSFYSADNNFSIDTLQNDSTMFIDRLDNSTANVSCLHSAIGDVGGIMFNNGVINYADSTIELGYQQSSSSENIYTGTISYSGSVIIIDINNEMPCQKVFPIEYWVQSGSGVRKTTSITVEKGKRRGVVNVHTLEPIFYALVYGENDNPFTFTLNNEIRMSNTNFLGTISVGGTKGSTQKVGFKDENNNIRYLNFINGIFAGITEK